MMYEQAAELLEILSHPRRLAIVAFIYGREVCVREIRTEMGISQSAASQHLSILRKADLVMVRKHARTVYYRCDDARVGRLIAEIQRIFVEDEESDPEPAKGNRYLRIVEINSKPTSKRGKKI